MECNGLRGYFKFKVIFRVFFKELSHFSGNLIKIINVVINSNSVIKKTGFLPRLQFKTAKKFANDPNWISNKTLNSIKMFGIHCSIRNRNYVTRFQKRAKIKKNKAIR